jgi:hypothetical protein
MGRDGGGSRTRICARKKRMLRNAPQLHPKLASPTTVLHRQLYETLHFAQFSNPSS